MFKLKKTFFTKDLTEEKTPWFDMYESSSYLTNEEREILLRYDGWNQAFTAAKDDLTRMLNGKCCYTVKDMAELLSGEDVSNRPLFNDRSSQNRFASLNGEYDHTFDIRHLEMEINVAKQQCESKIKILQKKIEALKSKGESNE